MDDADHTRLDTLLNLLADEVAKRLEERSDLQRPEPESPQAASPVPPTSIEPEAISTLIPEPASELESGPASEPELEPAPEPEVSAGASTSSHTAPLLARLALGVLVLVVLINIPFNAQGMAIARSIPNSSSLIIRDGLLVKEATSPDVWVYRDGAFHWITSLEAFEHLKYRWEDVHIVEPGFLSRFEEGKPLYLLLKCDTGPHVYRFEAGLKRWIVDIPTFESEGYFWQDIKFVPCNYLRGLPDGESIPPGRSSPLP